MAHILVYAQRTPQGIHPARAAALCLARDIASDRGATVTAVCPGDAGRADQFVIGAVSRYGADLLDLDDLAAGRSILEFIQESIKKCDAVVSIVSGKSLQSGWVSQESVASMYAVWMADKKFIPVRLDDMVFDSKFQIMALKTISAKIQELDSDIVSFFDFIGLIRSIVTLR